MSAERKTHQDKRQRLTNAVLDAYVTNERNKGRRLSKIEARKEEGFKSVMRELRTPKLTEDEAGDLDYMRDLWARRREALNSIGGRELFEKAYNNRYSNALRVAA